MSWLRRIAPVIAAIACLLFMLGATGCKTLEKHKRDLDSSDDEDPMPGPEGPDPRPPPT